MSYILDALKKSSEERRKHEAEQHTTFRALEQAVGRSTRHRTGSAVRLFLLLAVIAAASAMGSWIFFTFHGTAEKERSVQATIENTDDTAGTVEPGPKKETPRPEKKAVPESVSSLPRTSPAISPSPAETIKPKPVPPVSEAGKETIPLLRELPLGIQSTLPEMKFSGHVFSQTPSLRMIMINTDIVREKEMVAADLRLLEITENGLIMEFQGTRFRIDLF